MIISYSRYSTLSLDDIDKALGQDTQLLIFFLFSSFDSTYQETLRRFATDIHELTGRYCAAIAFAPPPPNARVNAASLDSYANGSEEPALWAAINKKMTENAYDIAEAFDIPRDALPAMLFVARDSEEFASLSLRAVSFEEFYPQLRSII